MIQFNLLPDVKMAYMKAQRTKRMLSSVSIVAAAVSLGLLLFSFFIVYVVQGTAIKSQAKKIQDYTKQLSSTPNLNKQLTVQNQLGALTGLHEQKPVTSRVFSHIGNVTPDGISLNKLSVDFATNKITLGGTAPSYDAVRIYADTLKTTKYAIKGSTDAQPAFTGVVLTSFAKDDKGASFTIDTTCAPALFVYANDITLEVTKGNRSNQDKLFEAGGGL